MNRLKVREENASAEKLYVSLSRLDINALPADGLSSTNHEISPPSSAGLSLPATPNNAWISPQANTVVRTEDRRNSLFLVIHQHQPVEGDILFATVYLLDISLLSWSADSWSGTGTWHIDRSIDRHRISVGTWVARSENSMSSLGWFRRLNRLVCLVTRTIAATQRAR